MKEKITAMISFLCGLGFGLLGFYGIFWKKTHNLDSFLIYSTILIYGISTVMYVKWTKFGNKEFSDLEKMDHENQVLKKQIEQKELKKKLEE